MIRQNIAVSLINVAFMVIAALLGYLGLVSGLLLNEGSAVFVILNALRLLSWKSRNEPAPVVVEQPPAAVPAAPVAAPAATAAGCCAAAPSTTPVPGGGCSCGEPPVDVRLPPSILVEDVAPSCACGGPAGASEAITCCGPAAEDRATVGASSAPPPGRPRPRCR